MALPKPLIICAILAFIMIGGTVFSYFEFLGENGESSSNPGNSTGTGNSTVPGNPTTPENSTDTGKHLDTGKKPDPGKQNDHRAQGNPEKKTDSSNSHSNIASRSIFVQNDVVQDLVLKKLKGYKFPPLTPEADNDLA